MIMRGKRWSYHRKSFEMLLILGLTILILDLPSACLGLFEHIKHVEPMDSSSQPLPYFDVSNNVYNVTSFVGQSSHLHCTVRDLGDKSVSWIRKSDLHVLTNNLQTFTGDLRFSAHAGLNDLWTLQIKFTELKDAGEYQCQVNTEPKISHSVFLFVREAQARIESPSDKEVHVRQRSRVQLRCAVNLGDQQESAAVFWYLNGQTLDWLGQTGPGRGVKVEVTRGNEITSTLTIEKADMLHAGKFTCAPSYAKPDTVTVHVIDSESRAELQGNSSSRIDKIPFILRILLLFFLF